MFKNNNNQFCNSNSVRIIKVAWPDLFYYNLFTGDSYNHCFTDIQGMGVNPLP